MPTSVIFFEQMRPRLTAISRRIVGSRAAAEDIVQDSFLKWHGARQAALATPAAWLTTVVQHASIDYLRRLAREAAAVQAVAEAIPATPPLPEHDLLQRAELRQALARMLACLSPSERLALVLHDGFDCTHADIAAALGTTAQNARQYLSRARRRLRQRAPEDTPDDKLCRDLIRRFHDALNGVDMAAMEMLLRGDQPMFVSDSLPMQTPANDASYRLALIA